VLESVELRASAGEWVAVTGPSGSGKSTLLHILGGLDADFTGEVHVAGQRLRGAPDSALAELRRKQVGFVFQAFHLVPDLSARDNVRLGAWFGSGMEPARSRARAEELLAQVGLEGRGADPPARLSGGERQRVALARALFGGPQILLCDEPTGNLDRDSGERVIRLLRTLRVQGLCVVSVTHEARLCAAADRVLELSAGRLVSAPGMGVA
jgi:putative ABC transport system ATP-binding protein